MPPSLLEEQGRQMYGAKLIELQVGGDARELECLLSGTIQCTDCIHPLPNRTSSLGRLAICTTVKMHGAQLIELQVGWGGGGRGATVVL